MRIAVVNTPFSTHIGRMIYVLEALSDSGHDVELWGSGATQAVAEAHDLTFRELPVKTDFDAVLGGRLQPEEIFTRLFFQLAREQLPTVLDYCERYAPDVLEANSRVFAATIASMITDIPVVTHCCSGNSFSQVPEDLYGFCASGNESDRQRAVMLKMSRRFFRETDDWFDAHISRWYGLGRISNAIGLCSPNYALAQTIPELSTPRIASLPGVHMTGPIVFDRPSGEDFARYEPYCYISLGTSPWNPEEILERYRALCRFVPDDLNIVIGLGGLATATELGIDDPRVIVFEQAPQIDAIRNAAAVICHGGCQTVHEALYFGKPVIGIPHHAEVSEMVNSVELAGAGVRIAPAKLSAATITAAFERIRSEEIRGRAGELGERLQLADGRANALAVFAAVERDIAERARTRPLRSSEISHR